jgi:hypothetical protein
MKIYCKKPGFFIYIMAKFNPKSQNQIESGILIENFILKSLTFALQKSGIYVRSYKNRRSTV